eukprot:1165643-Prymnesium_polylepis.1
MVGGEVHSCRLCVGRVGSVLAVRRGLARAGVIGVRVFERVFERREDRTPLPDAPRRRWVLGVLGVRFTVACGLPPGPLIS